ncbi:MAG: hypothetical protein AABX00_02080 [Nanoarchaeota archaeon]
MELKMPSSVEDCVYFTNRTIGSGRAIAWAFRKECPKCKKGAVGKPMKKNGKIDKKAEICKCNSCGYEEPTEQAESGLVLNVDYKCPHCGNEGQTTTEYKRKTFEGVPSYIFECTKCKKKIGITKKLKEPKKKKIADAVEE